MPLTIWIAAAKPYVFGSFFSFGNYSEIVVVDSGVGF